MASISGIGFSNFQKVKISKAIIIIIVAVSPLDGESKVHQLKN